MNPSSAGIWCNPPPPGTDEDLSNSSVKRESPDRLVDPFLKSSEYIKYERRRRSRSRSRHRRHRSRSRGRHRHRRRRYSSSRSRSRSHRRHKRSRHSRSHSRTRSRSRSHRSRRRRSRSRRRTRTRSRSPKLEPQLEEKKEEEEVEEEEEEETSNENMFKNDGSFMEMFKKMQEEQMKKNQAESATENKAPQPIFGKRRGGKVLKTGMVQKNKTLSQEESDAEDAWTLYMKEVKRYKEACCDDDSKTRLLVK